MDSNIQAVITFFPVSLSLSLVMYLESTPIQTKHGSQKKFRKKREKKTSEIAFASLLFHFSLACIQSLKPKKKNQRKTYKRNNKKKICC